MTISDALNARSWGGGSAWLRYSPFRLPTDQHRDAKDQHPDTDQQRAQGT